jgi:hypothetical protein
LFFHKTELQRMNEYSCFMEVSGMCICNNRRHLQHLLSVVCRPMGMSIFLTVWVSVTEVGGEWLFYLSFLASCIRLWEDWIILKVILFFYWMHERNKNTYTSTKRFRVYFILNMYFNSQTSEILWCLTHFTFWPQTLHNFSDHIHNDEYFFVMKVKLVNSDI